MFLQIPSLDYFHEFFNTQSCCICRKYIDLMTNQSSDGMLIQNRLICTTCVRNYSRIISSCPQCKQAIILDRSLWNSIHVLGMDIDFSISDCCTSYLRRIHSLVPWHLKSCSYKPRPKFFQTVKDPDKKLHGRTKIKVPTYPLYFGVELEVDNNEFLGQAKLIDAILPLAYYRKKPLFYFKRDGTIPDGVEIVTNPATLAFHRQIFPWGKILQNLQTSHAQVTDHCGLHIHFDKSALSLEQAKLFATLFYTHRGEFELFARRYENRFTSYAPPSVALGGRDKYLAVNFRNRRTIEVRIFQSTLDTNTIYGALELIHALVRYCQHLSTVFQEISFYSSLFSTDVSTEEFTARLLIKREKIWNAFEYYITNQSSYQYPILKDNLNKLFTIIPSLAQPDRLYEEVL